MNENRIENAALEIFSVPVTRRAFLRKSLIGTLVLSSSSLFLTSCASYKTPETELLALSPKEFACLNGVCDALVPFDSENLPRPSEIGTARAVDKLLSTLPDENKKQMKLLFSAFEHSPLIFAFSKTPFSQQPLDKQRKILASLENNSLSFARLAFMAIKMLAMLGYYTRDAAWKAIGYDGPLVKS